jgi:hypothetical protein
MKILTEITQKPLREYGKEGLLKAEAANCFFPEKGEPLM